MSSFSERLADLMTRHRIKPAELATLSGVSVPYIYELKKGSAGNPSADKLSAIAKALNTTTDYLAHGKTEEMTAPETPMTTEPPPPLPPIAEELEAFTLPHLIIMARLMSRYAGRQAELLQHIFRAMERLTPQPPKLTK